MLLRFLEIIGIIVVKKERRYHDLCKLNSWHPLSYLVLICFVAYFFVKYGIQGVIKNWGNPFK